jgi:chitin disaccharide deacetylase
VKRLIVNADDFGLTPGINAAVVELNRSGALSSATIMAAAEYFAPAAEIASLQTTLGVGCHVVLVDGTPVSPAAAIPSLLDQKSSGAPRFRQTIKPFLIDLMRGRIRESEIVTEAVAQIRRAQSSGLRITHLDTHKHTHIFRRVLRPLLDAARQCGIPALRNPFEPGWSIQATRTSSFLRKMQVRLLQARRHAFIRFVRSNGLSTTDGAAGVLATGTLDQETLRAILHAMPEGTWELVCHPGYQDDALGRVRTRLRASREIERTSLLEVLPKALAEDPELALIDFSQIRS